jgi:hypothetical protein
MVARSVREASGYLWLARLGLGLVVSIVMLILTEDILGAWSLLLATALGAATVWRSNGRRLLQIGSEVSGRLGGQSVPLSAMPKNPELVSAISINPGDWVYSRAAFQEMLRRAGGMDCRGKIAEGRRTEPGRVASGMGGDAQEASKQDPAMPLQRVIVAARSSDSKVVDLVFANGNEMRVLADAEFYCRRPKRPEFKQNTEEPSRALSALLTLLGSNGAIEKDLVDDLARRYSSDSVRRALRTALRERLVVQEAGFGRCIREVCAVFSSRMDTGLRRKCIVELSRVGESWVRGGRLDRGKAAEAEQAPVPPPSMIHVCFINEQTVHTSKTVSGSDRSDDFQPPPHKNERAKAADVEDNGSAGVGTIVAWSAGVSGAGAGLAIPLEGAETAWQRILFILLILISSCAFVVLTGTGLFSIVSWRRARTRLPIDRDVTAGDGPANPGTD